MSYRMVVISTMTVIFSILLFTCILENNYSSENDLIHIRSVSACTNWRPFIPYSHKEAHVQFIVERILSQCEKRCEQIYGSFMTEDFASACSDTCYEIWGFPSRAKR